VSEGSSEGNNHEHMARLREDYRLLKSRCMTDQMLAILLMHAQACVTQQEVMERMVVIVPPSHVEDVRIVSRYFSQWNRSCVSDFPMSLDEASRLGNSFLARRRKLQSFDLSEFSGFESPGSAALFYTTDHLFRIVVVSLASVATYGVVGRATGVQITPDLWGRTLELILLAAAFATDAASGNVITAYTGKPVTFTESQGLTLLR
jgi:hypothetical protein